MGKKKVQKKRRKTTRLIILMIVAASILGILFKLTYMKNGVIDPLAFCVYSDSLVHPNVDFKINKKAQSIDINVTARTSRNYSIMIVSLSKLKFKPNAQISSFDTLDFYFPEIYEDLQLKDNPKAYLIKFKPGAFHSLEITTNEGVRKLLNTTEVAIMLRKFDLKYTTSSRIDTLINELKIFYPQSFNVEIPRNFFIEESFPEISSLSYEQTFQINDSTKISPDYNYRLEYVTKDKEIDLNIVLKDIPRESLYGFMLIILSTILGIGIALITETISKK
jgi:hypothetical protein